MSDEKKHVRWYYDYFRKKKMILEVLAWLKKNPPPANWEGGKYAYAYTEMPTGSINIHTR